MAGGKPSRGAMAVTGLGLAALLGSCSLPQDEAFYGTYTSISGPAGFVHFVDWTELRSCSWFECGESSHKTLGFGLEAKVVRRLDDGSLEWTSVARRDCGVSEEACYGIGTHSPKLRLVDGRLDVIGSIGPPDAHTIGWSGLRDFELLPGRWLCIADRRPAAADASLLKIAPTPAFDGIAEVVFALERSPSGEGDESRCTSLATLPQPARPTETLALTDALTDSRGHLRVAYRAKNGMYDWEGTLLLAVHDGEHWIAERELRAVDVGEEDWTFSHPGFLDPNAGSLVLAVDNHGAGNGAQLRRWYRSGGEVREERLR